MLIKRSSEISNRSIQEERNELINFVVIHILELVKNNW